MKHSLRSAFTRWLQLHNEEWRLNGHKSIKGVPNWFGYEVRKRCEYKMFIDKKWDLEGVTYLNTRRSPGFYEIKIDDELLLEIKRPNYSKVQSNK